MEHCAWKRQDWMRKRGKLKHEYLGRILLWSEDFSVDKNVIFMSTFSLLWQWNDFLYFVECLSDYLLPGFRCIWLAILLTQAFMGMMWWWWAPLVFLIKFKVILTKHSSTFVTSDMSSCDWFKQILSELKDHLFIWNLIFLILYLSIATKYMVIIMKR
jgi:hypothetical protein